MTHTVGYAATGPHSKLKPYEFERSVPKANEVEIEILNCGICHSDVHQARNEWHNTIFPCMPGHEIVGKVVAAGSAVKKFSVGDRVGVGCLIDSCQECSACMEGLEQLCERGCLATYNGNMKTPTKENNTFGGYSSRIVVRDDYVLSIPDSLSSAEAAPILCAGVTTYSPMKRWGVGPGKKVGVIGLGGLGQMAVKIAKAMGAEVTVITTSPKKHEDALLLGASRVILSESDEQMKSGEGTLDFILSTIPESHNANIYFPLLRHDGVLTIVGCIAPLLVPTDISKMIMERKTLATSLIGGIRETQEVLDFCAKHSIKPNIKVVPIDFVNSAFDDLADGRVDFRYVIDMSSMQQKHQAKGIFERLLS